VQRLARTADVAGSLSPTQHPAPSSHSLVNKSGLQKCPLIPIHRGVVAEQPSEMRAVPSAIIVKTESYEVLSSELTVPLSRTRHVCSSTLGLTKDHKHTSCVRSYFHGHVCLVSVRVRGALRASPDLLRPVDLIEADVFCSQKAPSVKKESKKALASRFELIGETDKCRMYKFQCPDSECQNSHMYVDTPWLTSSSNKFRCTSKYCKAKKQKNNHTIPASVMRQHLTSAAEQEGFPK